MPYDFSTKEKMDAFKKAQSDVPRWREPLPNLKWITESEFAQSNFFMFHGGAMFTRSFGGPNKDDNLAQLPEDFTHPTWTSYARCFFVEGDVSGFVLLSEYHHSPAKPVVGATPVGKIWFGRFAFCEHKNTKRTNLGRCYNRYDCLDCGRSHTIDSSD